MRLPSFRVRTLILVVGLVALLLWGAIMGLRSSEYYRLARFYEFQGQQWRFNRGHWDAKLISEITEYFAELSRKYHQAMWRPWMPVAPDPHAPGYDQWVEQERQAKAFAPDPAANRNRTSRTP